VLPGCIHSSGPWAKQFPKCREIADEAQGIWVDLAVYKCHSNFESPQKEGGTRPIRLITEY
jgi:hypothetical protein